MDNKFYVSLEAARLLKEKGYDRECVAYYQNDEFHPYALSRYELSINNKNAAPPYMEQYSAPTKDEAVDWLESKGMCIIVFRRTIDNKVEWRYVIHGHTEIISGFQTRLEAKDAAIIKACKLLENGN